MAYKILLFLKDGVYNLKEIGEKLKEARDNIGISIEEAAEDLKVLPSQIETIENGEMDKFKDVFSVKYFIRDYAKYLGLKYEDLVDEFNEYLFDYTSKLSIDDIKNAKKKEVKKEEPKISSPYTLEPKEPYRIPSFVYILIALILIGVVGYFVYDYIKDNNDQDKIIALVE